eukprot:97324-Hanusia_phi.AAC.1
MSAGEEGVFLQNRGLRRVIPLRASAPVLPPSARFSCTAGLVVCQCYETCPSHIAAARLGGRHQAQEGILIPQLLPSRRRRMLKHCRHRQAANMTSNRKQGSCFSDQFSLTEERSDTGDCW